jgi:energy-coupling factor transporter ATP-binding protein EcfA2
MANRAKLPPLDAEPLVSRIEVEQLFYTYSYSLSVTPTPGPESGKLMLLYGNNGSGKTTILNLLYHLLHPEPYGNHRLFVGSVPFKLFRVHLLDGIVVTAHRPRKYAPGSYYLTVADSRHDTTIKWKWTPDRSHRVPVEEPAYREYYLFLKKLQLSFHYLRDTRRVEGAHMAVRQVPSKRFVGVIDDFSFPERGEEEHELLTPEKVLTTSIESAMNWFRQHALSATNIGYTSVNTIYRDLIRRIVTPGKSDKREKHPTAQELTKALLDLRDKNGAFAHLGLTPELDVKDIVDYLKSAGPEHLSMLNTVLGPYLEGHAARLDALQELQRVMSSFVSLLCQFYSHKDVRLHLEKGLQLVTDKGQELDPNNLSSGEKQLLLLFCNAISSRQNRTILMIDEPEISLNVKWQRELIPALLTCLSGTAFQLILATHSVELLARYRNYVTPLSDTKEVGARG